MIYEYDTYLEAKSQASNFLKEERVISVRIHRKRDEPKWVVEVKECSKEFFDKFIYKENEVG